MHPILPSNLLSDTILGLRTYGEGGTRVKSVDDRICGQAVLCPKLGWDVQDSSVNCGCNSRLAVPLMYTCVTEN